MTKAVNYQTFKTEARFHSQAIRMGFSVSMVAPGCVSI